VEISFGLVTEHVQMKNSRSDGDVPRPSRSGRQEAAMNAGKDSTKPPRRRNRWQRLAFHLAAAVVVLLPLVLGELALRLCVAAPPIRAEDPYISFSNPSSLFVLDETGTRFEIAAERLVAFRPQSFSAAKAPGAFRAFCLGGSTVQGRPYSIETSFTTWLRLDVEAARPDTHWEIINCGGISYASYRLVPIMAELLGYEPDLFVVYAGHNEFLEDRTYGHLKKTPRALVHLHRTMLHLRSYALADQWLARRRAKHADVKQSSKTALTPEVQTKLDIREGLEAYHRDPTWRQGTINHFARNLEAMVQMARSAGVPLILVNPVSNLKDCPPFKSQCGADLTEAERQRTLELWKRAGELGWSDVYEKIGLLEQAAAIDNQHAALLYLIGMCYEHVGRATEAKQWFVRAKEQDICPLRILEPMHEAILEIAARYRIPLVDARAIIEQRTNDRTPGEEWLLDHVHPSIAGHQLIANALYETMVEMDLVHATEHWQTERDQRRRRHLATLNDAYYAQGRARLKRLHQWSRGRIPDPPAPPAAALEKKP